MSKNKEEWLLSKVMIRNVVINKLFLSLFDGDFTKAIILSRYHYFFLKNNNNPITYNDEVFTKQYYFTQENINQAKKQLEEEGFIQSTLKKGKEIIRVNSDFILERMKEKCGGIS